MKLLHLSLLLAAADAADADSHQHAKHKSSHKSAHKAKHHHKKDLDAENEDLMQILADPNNDPLSDLINASPEDFEKLLTSNQDQSSELDMAGMNEEQVQELADSLITPSKANKKISSAADVKDQEVWVQPSSPKKHESNENHNLVAKVHNFDVKAPQQAKENADKKEVQKKADEKKEKILS